MKRRSVWVVELLNDRLGWVVAAGGVGFLHIREAWKERRSREAKPALKGIKYRVVRYDASK